MVGVVGCSIAFIVGAHVGAMRASCSSVLFVCEAVHALCVLVRRRRYAYHMTAATVVVPTTMTRAEGTSMVPIRSLDCERLIAMLGRSPLTYVTYETADCAERRRFSKSELQRCWREQNSFRRPIPRPTTSTAPSSASHLHGPFPPGPLARGTHITASWNNVQTSGERWAQSAVARVQTSAASQAYFLAFPALPAAVAGPAGPATAPVVL